MERTHVEVARSDHCHIVIDAHRFGVEQDRCVVLIDVHSCIEQVLVVGTLCIAHQELIRHLRVDQLDVYPTLCRTGDCRHQRVVSTKYGLLMTTVFCAAWIKEVNSFRLFSCSKPEPLGSTWQRISPAAIGTRAVSGAVSLLSKTPVSEYQSVRKAASSWAAMGPVTFATSSSW